MANLEYHEPTPADLGSYEVERGGKAKITRRPEIEADEFAKQEAEYEGSAAREKAVKGLLARWFAELGMGEIVDRDEIKEIFYAPDKFIARLEDYGQELTEQNFIGYLNEVTAAIRQKLALLEEKRPRAVSLQLGYKATGDEALDEDLKSCLRRIVSLLDMYIEHALQVLAYIEDKKLGISVERP